MFFAECQNVCKQMTYCDLLYDYKSQTILICIFVFSILSNLSNFRNLRRSDLRRIPTSAEYFTSSILPNFLPNFGNLEVLSMYLIIRICVIYYKKYFFPGIFEMKEKVLGFVNKYNFEKRLKSLNYKTPEQF